MSLVSSLSGEGICQGISVCILENFAKVSTPTVSFIGPTVQWPAGKTLGTPDTFPMVKGLVVPLDKMRRAHDKMSECVVLGREEVGLSTIISTMLSAVLLSGIW